MAELPLPSLDALFSDIRKIINCIKDITDNLNNGALLNNVIEIWTSNDNEFDENSTKEHEIWFTSISTEFEDKSKSAVEILNTMHIYAFNILRISSTYTSVQVLYEIQSNIKELNKQLTNLKKVVKEIEDTIDTHFNSVKPPLSEPNTISFDILNKVFLIHRLKLLMKNMNYAWKNITTQPEFNKILLRVEAAEKAKLEADKGGGGGGKKSRKSRRKLPSSRRRKNHKKRSTRRR